MFPATIATKLHSPETISRLNLGGLTIQTRYRGHPQLNRTDHENLFRHELVCAVESGGICASISCENETAAICAIKPLTWDSQHFGYPMAKLTLAAAPIHPPATLHCLLKETFSTIKQETASLHISCEVDIDDYPCLNALIGFGAEILDIKREYRWTSLKGIQAPKFLSCVRDYQPEDKAKVMQLLEESHFDSRFSRDQLLDQRKTEKLYQIWLEKLLDGKENDRIALVMERNGRVQACGTIEKQDLSHAGVNVQLMSGGLYVSCAEAIGSYYPIIYSLTNRASIFCDSSQTCVSLNNHSAVKVLEKMNLGTASTRYALRIQLYNKR